MTEQAFRSFVVVSTTRSTGARWYEARSGQTRNIAKARTFTREEADRIAPILQRDADRGRGGSTVTVECARCQPGWEASR